MSRVHDLILVHGRAAALDLAGEDRHLVNLAAAVLGDEHQTITAAYSGFCQTSLPLRETGEQVWRRQGGDVTMLLEAGLEEDGITPVGLPFGPKARLILLYLQDRAIKTRAPEVELGACMHAWLREMGLSVGGKTYHEIKRQARRISAARLTFFVHRQIDEQTTAAGRHNGAFVENDIAFSTRGDPRQGSLWNDTVQLHPAFFRAIMAHPVPLQAEAVRQISGKAQALDIYMWLAWRLHVLDKPLKISWPALMGQFGGSIGALKHFKPEFTAALKLALAVYPQARVELDAETGAVLHPSASPVERRLLPVK